MVSIYITWLPFAKVSQIKGLQGWNGGQVLSPSLLMPFFLFPPFRFNLVTCATKLCNIFLLGKKYLLMVTGTVSKACEINIGPNQISSFAEIKRHSLEAKIKLKSYSLSGLVLSITRYWYYSKAAYRKGGKVIWTQMKNLNYLPGFLSPFFFFF